MIVYVLTCTSGSYDSYSCDTHGVFSSEECAIEWQLAHYGPGSGTVPDPEETEGWHCNTGWRWQHYSKRGKPTDTRRPEGTKRWERVFQAGAPEYTPRQMYESDPQWLVSAWEMDSGTELGTYSTHQKVTT